MDTHKDTLAVALIDPSGRRREAITVPNTVVGHGQLVQWLTVKRPGFDAHLSLCVPAGWPGRL